MYQPYPGGPQQVYYVPAHGTQTHAGFLSGVQAQIRNIASTEKLEGFSLGRTFSETFKRHGADAVDDYMMVGSSRTTPPIELVDTNWPRPWMFFRLLAIFTIASVVLYAVWLFTGNIPLISALQIMGAFGVPVAVLVFIFEMNTPRNVSVVVLGKLFVIGGLTAICAVSFEYMNAVAGKMPGVMEETAKLAALLIVMRSARYKYELNGILFGCAVGAGFACFETTFYAFQSLMQALNKGANGDAAVQAMMSTLVLRAVTAPFLHVVWTAIAAGAFWRVKQDRPVSASMLLDGRFLKAFAIPVVMHTLWDASVILPNLNGWIDIGLWIGTGLTSWYVLFTMIQQGLHQVKDVQVRQLQSTLASMQPVVGTYAMQPQGLASA